jgi:hypothetical protein
MALDPWCAFTILRSDGDRVVREQLLAEQAPATSSPKHRGSRFGRQAGSDRVAGHFYDNHGYCPGTFLRIDGTFTHHESSGVRLNSNPDGEAI